MKRQHSNSSTAIWASFCRIVVKVFYRRFEISGVHHLPENKGLILCANHVNALADPVIVQASTQKSIHPLARSGLFKNILLRPWLNMMGAVPIYRPGDKGSNVRKNKDSFSRCYELLAGHQSLIIFPEGQSHSDPSLHLLKSGAARLTLGALEVNQVAPVVIPVGLNFSRKGRFRGDVLVNFGEPIDMDLPADITPRQTVRLVNDRITAGLKTVTINADSWEDIDLVRRLERFFALRHGKIRRGNLSQRFSALQRLIDAQHLLREHEPDKLRAVKHELRTYERLCRRFGIRDYHLTLNYRPWFILINSMRILLTILVGLPLVIFAFINGGVPLLLTAYLSEHLAKSKDQLDTAKIVLGVILFTFFWGVQSALVYYWFGFKWLLAYLLTLAISTSLAVKRRGRYGQNLEDIRVFFTLIRKKDLKLYLLEKRRDIEVELARLVRMAKQLSKQKNGSTTP